MSGATTKQPAAQVSFARKAAKLKAKRQKPKLSVKQLAANQAHLIEAGLAADGAQDQSDRKHAHGARAPPVRLLDKAEILQITGVSFPTIWSWMRDGKFPRSRATGGSNSKSVWLSSEIEAWIAGLPLRPLKGDDARPDQKIEEPEPV